MRPLRHILSAVAIALLPLAGYGAEADSLASGTDSSNPIKFGRVTPEVATILKANRAPEVQPVQTPVFNIATANKNFILTIGGQVNVITGFDIGNNLYKQSDAGISFVTSAIPVPATSGHKGDYYINPLNGFVDFQVVGLAGTDNEISGYIKLGTNGINSSVSMQRAYLTYRRFTAGMKLTLFQDAYACQPPTIDPEGPSGCVSTVAYEIGYTSKSYNGFRFAAALDMPSYYNSNGYYRGKDYPEFDDKQVLNDNAEELMPDIPMWVEYSSEGGNRVRLSGIVRRFSYRDLVAGKKRSVMGWGAMISGNLYPSSKFTLYYQAAYGKGIGAYLQDIAGKPISFVPDNENPGKLKASPMMGLNIGVSYNPTKKLQFNAMFSESRIWDVAEYCNALPEGQNYKYALYGAVNCFYNITPYLQTGIEYLWGRRKTWNIGGANDSRIQAQIAFSF
ncbi:MAG: hypothetical protein J6C77_03320 [Muribaculaceae bacterium]|nr:hypothetical protein [Muribaculaceae bacterium]